MVCKAEPSESGRDKAAQPSAEQDMPLPGGRRRPSRKRTLLASYLISSRDSRHEELAFAFLRHSPFFSARRFYITLFLLSLT